MKKGIPKEEWESAVKTTLETYGKVNVLVNTAGTVGPSVTKAAEHDINEGNKVIAINLKGAFLGTKLTIPEWKGWSFPYT
ncbi:SDR family NAD(P)-dependent oxidoreductase [Virgibacillus sp. NKC19-16]|uniref:SDR family NAD(P)-dependent oxidoreductase n=1 Tax=Virgibacillus salidurans TaxID=2831673 RepID=UPI001F418F9A|nr:SDR family NAD(P)-dependent oxidoreductase [Virgibacillus sp. NKC19-16]UJL45764.1 SDR family NAD(P)-dependent oxidoreductase [Virgibacillus sp. NKC19-16]